MVKGPRYNLPFRRRREGKTDYRKRRALILSGLPRLVVRPTNEHVVVQVVEAKPEGDRVLASASTIELKNKYGWKGGCGNVPAAYLAGLLAGFKALKNNVKRAILDIGLRRATKGAKVFAAMKGAVDAGLEVPHDSAVLPDPSRIRGEHIAAYAESLSSDQGAYKRQFSKYLEGGLNPEDLPSHFDQVKGRLIAEFKGVSTES